MLENGLEFILDAINHLEKFEKINIDNCKERKKELKYCLLHLSSGIELILKDRLHRTHWTYIFSDMNKANRAKFEKNSFNSVDSSTVIERLEELCEIKINSDEKEKIRKLREIRNKIEHFAVNENYIKIQKKLNEGITIIINFINLNYKNYTLKNDEETLFQEIILGLNKLNEHHKDAVEMAKANAEKVFLIEEMITCLNCNETLLKCGYEKGKCHCYFCGLEEDGEKLSEKYMKYFKSKSNNDDDYVLFKCVDCKCMSLIYEKKSEKYICLSCGMYYRKNELGKCSKCNELYYIYDSENDTCECEKCKK